MIVPRSFHPFRCALHALLAAAAIAAPSAGYAQEGPAISLSTVPIDSGAEPYFARDEGFFKAAGLNVNVTSASQGAAILPGVISGATDIGFANLSSLAGAIAKGAPLTIIAPAALYSSRAPSTACFVAKTSPIRTAAELNGKTFAISGIRGIGEFGPRSWMDKNGGDSSTVKFVEMPLAASIQALAEHKVDAIAASEPFVTDAKEAGRVIGNCYDGIAPRFLIAGFFTTTAWANAHPDLVGKFAAAMRQTAIWANKNHDKTAAIVARESKLDLALLLKSTRALFAERVDPRDVQPLIDVTARYGAIPASFPASSMIYHTPLP